MHGKKNDPWRVLHGFDLLRHSKAIHIWQFNIEQNQICLNVSGACGSCRTSEEMSFSPESRIGSMLS
jgi:Fe-S cluster biogenesis protein NfuA